MNVLILGGNSLRHKQWVRDVQFALEPHFERVVVSDYRHWRTGDPNADVAYEIEAACALAEGLGEYVIVAKSIGTVIASLGIARELLKPRGVLLLGVPLSGAVANTPEMKTIVPKLPYCIVMQNTHDPLGSASDVRDYIASVPPEVWRLEAPEGSTHDYVDFDAIVRCTLEVSSAANED